MIKVVTGTTTHAPVQDGSARGAITGAVMATFSLVFTLLHADADIIALAAPIEGFFALLAFGVYDKIVKPRFDVLFDDSTTTDPPETLHATSEPPSV